MTTAMTVSFIFIGLIGFLQVADDLNVWVRIDRLCKRGKRQCRREIIQN